MKHANYLILHGQCYMLDLHSICISGMVRWCGKCSLTSYNYSEYILVETIPLLIDKNVLYTVTLSFSDNKYTNSWNEITCEIR